MTKVTRKYVNETSGRNFKTKEVISGSLEENVPKT